VNLSVMVGELRYRIDSGRVSGCNRISVISGWWVLSCMVKGCLWGDFFCSRRGWSTVPYHIRQKGILDMGGFVRYRRNSREGTKNAAKKKKEGLLSPAKGEKKTKKTSDLTRGGNSNDITHGSII